LINPFAPRAVGIVIYTGKSWIDRLNEMNQQRQDLTNNTIQCGSGNTEACNNLPDQQRNLINQTRDTVDEGNRVKVALAAPRKINNWDNWLEKLRNTVFKMTLAA